MRHAVVMAAGEGARMRPLTEDWPKPILPIDGRPVIATLLRDLAVAGIVHAVVVTGHLAGQVEELVGDGSAFGLRATFARQPEALGSADAVRRARSAGAEAPFLVAAADTVFGCGDLERFAAAADGAAGALAVRRSPPPEPPHRWGTRVDGDRVVEVLDRSGTSDVSGAPLWALGGELVPFLDGLGGPPYELAETFERGLAAGLGIRAVEIGRTRDLTRPADLVRENFRYLGLGATSATPPSPGRSAAPPSAAGGS